MQLGDVLILEREKFIRNPDYWPPILPLVIAYETRLGDDFEVERRRSLGRWRQVLTPARCFFKNMPLTLRALYPNQEPS